MAEAVPPLPTQPEPEQAWSPYRLPPSDWAEAIIAEIGTRVDDRHQITAEAQWHEPDSPNRLTRRFELTRHFIDGRDSFTLEVFNDVESDCLVRYFFGSQWEDISIRDEGGVDLDREQAGQKRELKQLLRTAGIVPREGETQTDMNVAFHAMTQSDNLELENMMLRGTAQADPVVAYWIELAKNAPTREENVFAWVNLVQAVQDLQIQLSARRITSLLIDVVDYQQPIES